MMGRVPLKLGSPSLARSPHCCAEVTFLTVAQSGSVPPAPPPAPFQQPKAGAPEKDAPPAKTSGYAATRTFVTMPPDEEPVTNTLFGSPLYLSSVFLFCFVVFFF